MSEPQKKTIYHSQLTEPTKIKVTSRALRSKFQKDPDKAGFEYLYIEIGGEKRIYLAENRKCADQLTLQDGREITVQAVGRGADASFIIDGVSDEKHDKTASQINKESAEQEGKVFVPDEFDPVKQAERELGKLCNAFWLTEKYVSDQHTNSSLRGTDGDLLTPENFGGKCNQAMKKLESLGLVDKFPVEPIWYGK